MKTTIMTTCILTMAIVLAYAFNSSAQSNVDVYNQQSASALSITKAQSKDSDPAPLTMLIVGSCLAGAATIKRRHHNN